MKIFVITASIVLCLLFTDADAGRGGRSSRHRGGNYGRGQRGPPDNEELLERCMGRCVSSDGCYGDWEAFFMMIGQGWSCFSCVKNNCSKDDGQFNRTACFGEICTPCQPMPEEFWTREANCLACEQNCTETYPPTPTIDPVAEELAMYDCMNACGDASNCSSVVTPNDLIVNQTESCKTCVKDECREEEGDNEAAEAGTSCPICDKVDKASCYGEALEDCYDCVTATEETKQGVFACMDCLQACTGEDDDEHDDDDGDDSDDDDSDDEDDHY